jgi:hypothetical protein
MGGLVWLGYLSHTQVVEGSNLSPSIVIYIDIATQIQVRSNIKMYTTKVIARKILVTKNDFSRAFE